MLNQLSFDEQAYVVLAALGTTLFMLRFLAMMVFGHHVGHIGHTGGVGRGAHIHGGTDNSFQIFSAQSILGFLMGTGWMGFAARLDWRLDQLRSALLSVGFGIFMMLFSAVIAWVISKFEEVPDWELSDCVGQIGQTYLTIPPKDSKTTGKVLVVILGRKETVSAVSADDRSIPAFTQVQVAGVSGDVLVVKPL